jgi:hypothetical protein
MVDSVSSANKIQSMLDYFNKYRGNSFYTRLNQIASEHSMPLEIRIKAAFHAMSHARVEDKIV